MLTFYPSKKIESSFNTNICCASPNKTIYDEFNIPWRNNSYVLFNSRDSVGLKRHVAIVHERRTTPVKCPRTWCEEEFYIYKEFLDHKETCFRVCQDCGKKYTRDNRFQGHLRNHAKQKERMV